MDDKIRELIIKPLSQGRLKLIIPDFEIIANGKTIKAPAELTAKGSNFTFQVFDNYFSHGAVDKIFGLGERTSGALILTKDNVVSVRGYLNGSTYFECDDVTPANFGQTTTPGINSIKLSSRTLQLPAPNYIEPSEDKESFEFHAHAIFHGPKLQVPNSGTKTTKRNDFLNELYSSSMDTQTFEGDTWEAAIIEQKGELHLHARSKDKSINSPEHSEAFFQNVMNAVGFTNGFKPWPLYYYFWNAQTGGTRWIRSHLKLKQSNFRPQNKRLWLNVINEKDSPLYNLTPRVAEGLALLPEKSRKRLMFLLWNVNEISTGQLPDSTQMLMLCSALDGLMRIAAEMEDDGGTDKVWKTASKKLGFDWNGWIQEIYKLRPEHRNELAHGRLWHMQEVESTAYFNDYPKLGNAFSIIFAKLCGYEGPISDENYQAIEMKDLMKSRGINKE